MARQPLATIGAAFVILFAVSIGVGYSVGASVQGDAEASARPTTTTVVAEAPTPSAPVTPSTAAGPRKPDRAHPLRVVMAGDSVMAGLTPPVKAALEGDGTVSVRFILTPSILRDPAVRFTWNTQLEEFNPEVVVMFVGTWESGVIKTATGLAPSDPGWEAQYVSGVLDPWIQLITSKGASVLWIGNPTVGNADANELFGELNAAFKDLPTRWPQTTYLESNTLLNGAGTGTGYHDVVVQPDGSSVRTRQTDGLHLCAGGAELLGRLVISRLAQDFGAVPRPKWETGAWRTDKVYPPERCPKA